MTNFCFSNVIPLILLLFEWVFSFLSYTLFCNILSLFFCSINSLALFSKSVFYNVSQFHVKFCQPSPIVRDLKKTDRVLFTIAPA